MTEDPQVDHLYIIAIKQGLKITMINVSKKTNKIKNFTRKMKPIKNSQVEIL